MTKQLFLTLTLSLISLPLVGMNAYRSTVSSVATPATPSAAAAITPLASTVSTTVVNPIIFVTADNQEVKIEKEIAELCKTISPMIATSEKIPLPNANKTDFEKLLVVLKIFGNAALNETQKVQATKTALNGYTTQDLIITLSVADFLDVPENIIQIIVECATPRIFDINNLHYLADQNIFKIIKNPVIEQKLLAHYLKQIPTGLAYWIYHLPSWKMIKTFNGTISTIKMSPCGQFLAAGLSNNTARIWNTNDGSLKAELKGHTKGIYCVDWSPCGNYLATGSNDETVRIWNTNDGSLKVELKGYTHGVCGVTWSPCGKFLATASYDKIARIWNTDGSLKATFTVDLDGRWSIIWSPCGNFLTTDTYYGNLQIWNTDGIIHAQIKTGGVFQGFNVTWSPCGNFLAASAASDDKTVRIWKTNGILKATLAGPCSVFSVAWSPCGHFLATGSFDDNARIWNVDGTLKATLTGHQGSVCSVAWSPCGQFLATGSWDKTVRIWNTDGNCVKTLTGHTHWVNSIAWSPCGKFLATASASFDGIVRIWNTNHAILNQLSIEQVLFLIHVYNCIKENKIVDFNDLGINYPKLLAGFEQIPEEIIKLLPSNVQYMARKPNLPTRADKDDFLDGSYCTIM